MPTIDTVAALLAKSGPTDNTDEAATATTGVTGVTSATGPTGSAGSSGPTGSTDNPGATGGSAPVQGRGAAGDGGAGTGGGTVSVSPLIGAEKVDICVRPGNRLILNLRARRTIEVAMPDFGRTGTATEFAPLIFDLILPADPGRFPVEELGTERRLATILSDSGCGRPGVLP